MLDIEVEPVIGADEFATHFSSSPFTIHLGSPSGPTYYINRTLLTSSSPYFSALLSFPGSESSTNSVTLPYATDNDAFKRFLHYLYTRSYDVGNRAFFLATDEPGFSSHRHKIQKHVLLQAKIYVLADKFLMHNLKEQALKEFRRVLEVCYKVKALLPIRCSGAPFGRSTSGVGVPSPPSPFALGFAIPPTSPPPPSPPLPSAMPPTSPPPRAIRASPAIPPPTSPSPTTPLRSAFKPRTPNLSTSSIISLTKFIYSNTPSRTPVRRGATGDSKLKNPIDPLRAALVEYLLSILAFLKKDETFLAMLAGEEEQAEEIVAPSSAEEQGPGATSEVPGKDGSNGGYDNRYEVDMEVQSKDINEWIGDLARDLVRGLPAECEGKKMKAEY